MAYRDRALIIDSLGNNWNQSTIAPGVTASASVSVAIKERIALTQLGWSMKNLTAANATAHLQVRDASIAGTILAQWEIVVAAGLTAQDSWVVNIKGLRGSPLYIGFNTAQASVGYGLSVAGWRDSLSDG